MRIQFVNGTKLDLTWHEMQRMFWHPTFVALVLVLSAIIILLRPYDYLIRLDALQLTLFYANGVGSFMACLVTGIYLAHRWGKTVISAVVITVSVVLASLWGLSFGVILGADLPRVADFSLVIWFNLTFGFLGEVILVTFLLPSILRDIKGPRPADPFTNFVRDTSGSMPSQSPPREIEVLGQRFVPDQILHVQAEEHYVRINLVGGQSHLIRGRISDACDALAQIDGKRIHRSHWLAAAAVAEWKPDRSGNAIVTTLGTVLPVARNRQAEVKAWAEACSGALKNSGAHKNKKAPAKGA
jgi:hypothetical protein